ncbi:MAG: putative porin [Limisphaerales bacterium]
MKKLKAPKNSTKLAVFAGATALMALACQSQAQSSDALIDKLVDKGILTTKEAQELREESDQDFNTAFQAKTGIPDWVTSYKLSGDFRGRFEQFTSSNPNFVERTRLRYRLRVGAVVSMKGNLETGFQLASGDPSGNYGGNPNSNTSTFQNDFSGKSVWINLAYGKWTPVNTDGWLFTTTIGKMENPFQVTPMVFDVDLTPEGAAFQGGYTFNEHHALLLTGAAFVLDEEPLSGQDPAMFGGQLIWNANWTQKISSSLGLAGFVIVQPQELTSTYYNGSSAGNVPYVNQGNTRVPNPNFPNPASPGATGAYVLANNMTPIVVDASATYKLDTFPIYKGAFPIKLAGEYIVNPGVLANNNQNYGIWAGITFGKSGTKGTWDISYRYEYIEADAWYDQLVDDDNVAYYQNAPVGAPVGSGIGMYGGTNIKGHLIRANYSFSDALTFTFTCYLNQLINPNLNTTPGSGGEPQSNALHVMADVMWKF